MNFTLVYGKSGSGKTAYIYNKIANILANSSNKIDEKIYLIVPEQSNLMSESNLIKVVKEESLMSVQVLTLRRMESLIEEELSGIKRTYLSKIGKSMIIYDLLSKNKSKLNFLGKTPKNVEAVSQMITELKKHNITLEKLQDLSFEDKYQELKFNDIMLLYGAYQEQIEKKMIDENDKTTLLASSIKDSMMFDNSHIFIDDFDGFTEQEYLVIEEIMKKAKTVTVTSTIDDINTLTNIETDIFYFNKLFALRLVDIAERLGAEINKVNLKDNLRSKNEELRFLENAFSNNDLKVYEKEVSNISLKIANDTYQELEDVAETIVDLVKNQGYRYNEIAIITDDTDKYSADCKAIFNEYDIPVFIDEKKKLNQNVLIQFILAMFEAFNKNYSYEAMFSYIKSDLLSLDLEKVYSLENYCRKWGIKGNKWQKEFAYEEVNEKQSELEDLRKQIINPLLDFKDSFKEDKTINQMVKSLYDFLVNNNIDKNLNKKIEETNSTSLADEYSSSYSLLISILDEMVLCFDEQKIGSQKFKDLLQIGLDNTELGKIPANQDQVILGDISRSKNHEIKVLFIVGVNDGTFPTNAREEGFINDNDRNFLRENGLSCAKGSLELLYDANYQVYKAFCMSQDKLFISYCSVDNSSKSIRPSITIKRIKRLFPKLKEESLVLKEDYSKVNELKAFESSLLKYKDFLEGKEIEEEWIQKIIYFYNKNPYQFNKLTSGYNYTNKSQDLSKDNIEKLYGKRLKASVSKLEKYKECPFSFHMEYGLKLKEREDLKVEMIDTGTFMHDVIDEFFKLVEEKGLRVKELTEDNINEIGRQIIEQKLEVSRYYMLTGTAKFRKLTTKLKKTVLDSIKYIINSLKVSNFDVYGTEVGFGVNSELKSQVIELDNGKQIELVGKIDRVDIGKIDDKTYVRIIDYKSSTKKIDKDLVEAGLQLQLLTYSDVVQTEKDFEAAGVLYFGLKDELTKVKDKTVSDEDLEKQMLKRFRMSGLLVADVKIIRAMDNTISNVGGTSQIIPAQINQSNEVVMAKSQAATKSEFNELQKTTRRLIKQISKEILNGKIDIKPYKYNKKTGCDYCKYKTICNFTPGLYGNEYNFV